jgi:hypothetical protein
MSQVSIRLEGLRVDEKVTMKRFVLRFKCNSCDYSCVSYDTMVPHCQDKHNSITATNVTDTPVDSTVEYWIQMVIRHQTRAMVPDVCAAERRGVADECLQGAVRFLS